MTLNEEWTARVMRAGAAFVRFVDLAALPPESTCGFPRAMLFGKPLSREYLRTIARGEVPAHGEFFSAERKMDALGVRFAAELESAGWRSLGKIKTGVLPHKTVALRAGLGFIGKNNLLVTEPYGCGLVLGKVLTEAPFAAQALPVPAPRCGDCNACRDACKPGALLGRTWDESVTREDMLTRKACTLCLSCMAACPYTARYFMEDPAKP